MDDYCGQGLDGGTSDRSPSLVRRCGARGGRYQKERTFRWICSLFGRFVRIVSIGSQLEAGSAGRQRAWLLEVAAGRGGGRQIPASPPFTIQKTSSRGHAGCHPLLGSGRLTGTDRVLVTSAGCAEPIRPHIAASRTTSAVVGCAASCIYAPDGSRRSSRRWRGAAQAPCWSYQSRQVRVCCSRGEFWFL